MDSFLSWIGGKKLLRNRIIEQFPKNNDFNKYVEVFGGAGWILFSKNKHAKEEIYNDINSNLVNLFKCVKYHSEEVQKELNFMINSRDLFYEYLSQVNSNALTDIQRAARFHFLVKLSYGSTIDTYGAVKKDIEKMKEYLSEAQKRLTSVVIENKTFESIIKKYDSNTTFFYLDPPYHQTEYHYNIDFKEDKHILLNNMLRDIKGKCLISYNDDEFIRRLYNDFNIIEIERNNNLTSRYNKNRIFKELIIKNY